MALILVFQSGNFAFEDYTSQDFIKYDYLTLI